MKKLRQRARDLANQIPSPLPLGDIVALITSTLKEQHKEDLNQFAEEIARISCQCDDAAQGRTVWLDDAHFTIMNLKAQ